MKIERFEDIKAWQEARVLTKMVYATTKKRPFSNDYSLVDQIRRASVSSMANTAEGFDSQTKKSFINFLGYSQRSTTEVQSHLYVAIDQEYLPRKEFDNIYSQCEKVKSLIGGFIKYLKTTDREK